MEERIKNNNIDIIDIVLMLITIISLLVTLYFTQENEKLLKQVDDADGKYNELSCQYEQLDKQYQELQNDYDYVVDVIRSSDKYNF